MTARRERAMFWAAAVAMWLVFVLQAVHTPVLLDDWYQLAWHKHHPLTLHSIWQYGHYNYFHFNPRIGDVLLMLINGPRAIHLLATPLVQLALVPLAFALAFARWPKPTLRDLGLLVALQLLIWLITPIPGIIYFYRPFATNYLWSFTTTIALFVPYRLELARPKPGPSRPYLVPIMLALGWLAGMGNEHTGPTAMAAMALLLVWAWRKRRLRAWMIAGALGLYIGYPMLFFAPGQTQRYAGMATKSSPLKVLGERGIGGNGQIVLDFIGEAQVALDFVVIAILVAWRRARASGRELATFGRERLLGLVAFVLGAGAIVVTQFASPTVGERLFFASAVLFACGLAIVIEWLFEEALVRRALAIALVIGFGYHVVRFIGMSWAGWIENQDRLAQLEHAAPGSNVQVQPYGMWKRSRWWWGDDLQYASLREYVAHEVYDLNSIEYDRHLHWAEPTPPDHFVATRTFDPPLTPAEDAKVAPSYIPTFWEWALVQLRRSRVLGPIADVKGHTLVHYVVDIIGSGLDDPQHRAVRVFDWTPSQLTFADGRQYDDHAGAPYVRVWQPSVPADLRDTYVVGCGTTTRVELQDDTEDHIGPLIPIALTCRGTYTAFMCDSSVCWLAGRYWR